MQPHGPHFARLWEAAVKSMKYHLRRTLSSQVATYEDLCTFLAAVEARLNSRNFCPLPDDPFNPNYLFPAHFLIGEPLTQLPAADFTDVKWNGLSSWEIYQQELQELWHRWPSDYVQSLQQLQRWKRITHNLQPGEVFPLMEENTIPFHLPRAVIKETHSLMAASFAL